MPVSGEGHDGDLLARSSARGGTGICATITLKPVAYALYALAGLNAFAAISRVAMIGKPPKPVTRGDALASVACCVAVATILVIAAMRLG